MTSLREASPLVTIDDYLETYKEIEEYRDRYSYKARQSLEFLQRKGLLPLTYYSDLFPELNKLASAIVWSGSISLVSRKWPKIALSLKEEAVASLRGIEDRLETHMEPTAIEREFKLGTNGAAYARLIMKIPGVFHSAGTQSSRQRKSSGFTLPEYLNFLASNYDELTGEDENLARRILEDHVDILLKTKRPKSRKTIYLNSSYQEKNAKAIADQALKLIQAVYPMIGLDENSIKLGSSKRNGKKYYYCRITFTKENIANAMEHYDLLR